MTPTEPIHGSHWPLSLAVGALILALCAAGRADDAPPAKEGPLVRMLRSGRLPEERQGAVIDMIGKRGTAADLAFLFDRAVGDGPKGLRARSLDSLAEAALTRGVKPTGDLSRLGPLVKGEGGPEARSSAVRLAGLWKVRTLVPDLGAVAAADGTPPELRAEALDALASVGGDDARARIEGLTGPGRPLPVRARAVAALARVEVGAAEKAAMGVLRDAKGNDDLTPLVAAFLSRKDGADRLGRVVAGGKIPSDAAKLVLRTVYALGRSDPALVNALTKAAGIDAEVKPLDPAAMEKVIADVAAKGEPARGEAVFRRADVGCMKCHAVSGAGGDVGPDLSAVGASSPVDYLVNSIMLPDQAIKEQYHTLVVLTADGQVFQGIVADRDDRRIVLKDATGALKTVPAADVEETKEGGSLMPKGLVNFLTRAEFVDLVRFLSELGKPGPFAVRSTPTVQRWRFLKPVPEELAAAVPDADLFRARVLGAEPSRWLPAYARTAGDLPLAEVADEAGSPVVYLRAEVEASQAGKVTVALDASEGVRAWLDETAEPEGGASFVADLTPGRHTLTFRVDTAARKRPALRVVVKKPEGSPAEYTVVGGR